MNKRVIIVHGWHGFPAKGWFPGSKKELEDAGFEVIIPQFPVSDWPDLHAWVLLLSQTISEPDEHTYLVGHSLGCPTILHYLELLRDSQKIGGTVLVAGFTQDVGIPNIKSFVEGGFRLGNIMRRCDNFVYIHSDNDDVVPIDQSKIMLNALGGALIVKHGFGHMSCDEGELQIPVLGDVVGQIVEMENLK